MTSMKRSAICRVLVSVLCFTFAFSLLAAVSYAKTREEIDARAKAAMDRFKADVKGGTEYLKGAKGVLVMPRVKKAGFVVGGQFGEGALLIGGRTVDYYSLASGSIGFQIGAEQYDIVILFMTDEVLNKFRNKEGWEAGLDAEVTIIKTGASLTVETLRSQHPVAGFVFDQKGLMAGVSIKGAKFSKIHPK